MLLTDKVYNVLKWVTLIFLPSTGTLYFALSGIWGFPYAQEVPATLIAINTFLGALLGISTLQYNKVKANTE